MPTGGLGFCHICSASGPEARLGVFNPQTQFQAGGRRGSHTREASAHLPRAIPLSASPSQAGKLVTTPRPRGRP